MPRSKTAATGRFPVGAHLKPREPLAQAAALGAEVAQIFVTNPRSWHSPLPRQDADALRESDVLLYLHAPYLVNLASPEARFRASSLRLLREYCDTAGEVGAAAVVVHGGTVTATGDVKDGIARWVGALRRLDSPVPVLIENTAGGTGSLARSFATLARLWDAVAGCSDVEVGFCLDTCHAHAAGEDLVGVVDRARAITGRIDLLHANDSRDEAGSGRDRHEHLGHGRIDPDVLADAIRAARAPVVIETATAHVGDDIAFARHALGATRPARTGA